MKGFTFAVACAVLIVCSEVSGQGKSRGRCPKPQTSFGICSFDPNLNCVDDSGCSGGQLCCQDGCGKTCKDPEYQDQPGIEIKNCPKPSSQFGICVYDENINCAKDEECQNGELCCPDGCNKVCKTPVTFQPIKPEPKPSFENNNNRKN